MNAKSNSRSIRNQRSTHDQAEPPRSREQTVAGTERPSPPNDERRHRHALRLLEQSDRLPAGSLRLALLREAVRVARTCTDERVEYAGRLRLTAAASRSGRCAEALENIEWCLERHLEEPEYFTANVAQVDLAVEFASVPGMLASNSRFSLATIEQSLAELRELLADRSADGRVAKSRAAVVDESGDSRDEAATLFDRARLEVFECTGRRREAAAVRSKLARTRPRLSPNSDEADGAEGADGALGSDVAVGSGEADTSGEAGIPGEARTSGGIAGASAGARAGFADHPLLVYPSPEREIAESLLPTLNSGQLSDAYLEHLRGYGLIADDAKHLLELAVHIDFCSESGALDRGLLLIDRHLHWLAVEDHDERARFEALVAIAGLLDLVCEVDAPSTPDGSASTSGGGTNEADSPRDTPQFVAAGPLTRIMAADHPDLRAVLTTLTTPATAATLADACWSAALDHARAFDKRNGTDAFRSRLADAEERSDERCDDLDIRQRQGVPSAGSARSAGPVRSAGSALQRPAAFRMLESTSSVSSIGWLRAARERASVEDAAGALWALQQAHEAHDRENSGAMQRPDVSARSLARPKREPRSEAHEHERGSGRKARRGRPALSGRPLGATEQPPFDDIVTGRSAAGRSAAGRSADNRADTPDDRSSDGRPARTDSVHRTDVDRVSAGATGDLRSAPSLPPSIKPALYELEIRLAVERDDLERAEKLAGWRVDHLIADDRLDLAEVELELGLLLFGVNPDRRRGDLERELTYARQNGLHSEAVVSILNALGELRLTQQRPREAVEFLLSSVALCGHDPDSDEVQRPLALLAHAQVALGQPEWARATLDRLLRHDLDRTMRAKALLLRASVLQKTGDLRAALDDADRSLSLYLELRYRAATVEACATLAALLEELKAQAGVVEAWRMAVVEAAAGSETPLTGHPGVALHEHPDLLGLRFRLARALLASERGREAVDELNRIFDASVKKEPGERAEILFWLGHAYRVVDDDETAYAVWNLALQLSSEVRDARGTVRTGLALGRLLLDNDDDECLPVLQHALALSRLIADGITTEVDALHLYAIAQCAFGDVEGLATFDDALDLAGRHAFDIDALIAAITESRARALDSLGLDDEALMTSARAARLYERLGDRASAGQAHLFSARLLVTQGRYAEALPVYRRSLDFLPLDAPVAELAAEEWQMVGERVQTAAVAGIASTRSPQLLGASEGASPEE